MERCEAFALAALEQQGAALAFKTDARAEAGGGWRRLAYTIEAAERLGRKRFGLRAKNFLTIWATCGSIKNVIEIQIQDWLYLYFPIRVSDTVRRSVYNEKKNVD